MRMGFVGPSYTVGSTSVADEEAINLYAQSVESQGAIVPTSAYGGKNAESLRAYFGTSGLALFAALGDPPIAGMLVTPFGRLFAIAGPLFCEVLANGTFTVVGTVASGGATSASMATNGLQILIVSGGHAFCFNLATGVLTDVTLQLQGIPIKVDYSDSYFIVSFSNSNLFQMSQVLDGTTWPGQLVNEVSVFADNIVSIKVNHRELWVCGQNHIQPYQDTGSAEIFDVIPGALIETGIAGPFCIDRLDNSVFLVGSDERGANMAWRSNGYTLQRISTYAVEADLNSYPTGFGFVSYSYQDRGHLFWVIYIPGSRWSWCYDVVEGLWHKRASWNVVNKNDWGPHLSWNHVFAFNQHLVGDWNSGNIYSLSANNFEDNGQPIRRLRRTPSILSEMERVYHSRLTVDFDMGNLNTVAPSDGQDFAAGIYGPNQGTVAVDVNLGGAVWQNPDNVFTPGEYATAILEATEYTVTFVEAFDSKLGLPFGPEHYFVLVTFSGPVPVVGSVYVFANVGTYTTLNAPPVTPLVSIAGGGAYLPTPTADQALFSFGGTVIPLQANTADTGTATVPAIQQSSDGLQVTGFDFNVSANADLSGIMVGVLAFANASGAQLTATLLKNGLPISVPLTLNIPQNPEILYFGTIQQLWDSNLVPVDLNNANFGVRLQVSCSSSITLGVSVGTVQIQLYAPIPSANFNYIGPAPILVDGNGNPRPPQAMLRFSDTRGKTWSNEHVKNLGVQGDYTARAIWYRLGQSRYRIYELSISDPIPVAVVDAYLKTSPSTAQP